MVLLFFRLWKPVSAYLQWYTDEHLRPLRSTRLPLTQHALQPFLQKRLETDPKNKKLKSFENWSRWSDSTWLTLEAKGVWSLVDGSKPPLPQNATAKAIKDRAKLTAKALKIIKKGVHPDLYPNIIDKRDPKAIWETLERVSSQVGQGVVYALLKEILNYLRKNKPKGYDKRATTIFGKVSTLVDRLQNAVSDNQTIWELIKIVVAADSLHDDFDHVVRPIFHTGDKTLDQIQQIVTSKGQANLADRATDVTSEAAMMFRPARNKGNDKCFLCGRKRYHARKWLTGKRKRDDDQSKNKNRRRTWEKNQRKANKAATEEHHKSDDYANLYPAGRAFMTREQNTPPKANQTWYLDSCASKHLTNNRDSFTKTRSRHSEFLTAGGRIMVSEEEGTVAIQMQNGKILELENIAYVPTADSNLVSLSQLQEAGITFYDIPDHMLLKRGNATIGTASRLRNLFVLDTNTPKFAKALKKLGRPTYLQSENKAVRLWHRRFAHASNARIIRIARNVDGMKIDLESMPDDKLLPLQSFESESSESKIQPRQQTSQQAQCAKKAAIAFDRIQTPCKPSRIHVHLSTTWVFRFAIYELSVSLLHFMSTFIDLYEHDEILLWEACRHQSSMSASIIHQYRPSYSEVIPYLSAFQRHIP